ncbi:hypothetical protein GF325_13375 [Candidatus Bathyarchaeota archaeon]|nr:hypothetical protein [Candidatus Bathyarchaeota archaeon]
MRSRVNHSMKDIGFQLDEGEGEESWNTIEAWFKSTASTKDNVPEFMQPRVIHELEDTAGLSRQVRDEIIKVILLFEIASRENYAGDSYLFFKHFTGALHAALDLFTLARDDDPNNAWQVPSNILKRQENDLERRYMRSMFPKVSAEDGNQVKRYFIDWFIEVLQELAGMLGASCIPGGEEGIELIESFLTGIYRRDYLRNFRQVNGISHLFRSPDPAKFTGEPDLLERYLLDHEIAVIVDLRGAREGRAPGALKQLLQRLDITRMVVNLTNRGDGKSLGPGYHNRAKLLRGEIGKVIREFLTKSGGMLVHCASGKDRTGIIAAIFQLLAGISRKEIIEDYTRTGLDAIPPKIIELLDFIDAEGGVEAYLETCGITGEMQISAKKRLLQ